MEKEKPENKMKALKILFVITDLGKGGAERFLLDLTSQLETYPHIDYRIASLYNMVQYEEFKNNDKIHFLDFATFSLKTKNYNATYSDLLNDFQPDIIHTNRFLAEFITSYDIRRSIKYVCHCHDNMVQFKRFSLSSLVDKVTLLNSIEYNYLIRRKYRKVPTYFIANSQHTYSYFQDMLPANQKKNIRLIPLGFNYANFFVERQYKQKKKKIKLLNVGSYQVKKNQVFLLDIAEELKKLGVEFEINLIGDGPEFQHIYNEIRNRKLGDVVFQHGLQSNVHEWYNDSDLYIHTAYYEPFGLVLLEAMASGLPIICLDGKGNRDIIKNDYNGYMFFEQEPKAFADKIVEYTQNEELYQLISVQAQEYAKRYALPDKTRELVDFYYSIIDSE
ncbi:MAG: glycosyltransferase family 4 protein [Crocinitomicaceae bacterium]|nr:glycosyltransferase family 4 protein [Crocinitomicaceae bacterium]NGF75359.1 glycosyltransferase family 4 protein [Fluviicola sp. SGL-29]